MRQSRDQEAFKPGQQLFRISPRPSRNIARSEVDAEAIERLRPILRDAIASGQFTGVPVEVFDGVGKGWQLHVVEHQYDHGMRRLMGGLMQDPPPMDAGMENWKIAPIRFDARTRGANEPMFEAAVDAEHRRASELVPAIVWAWLLELRVAWKGLAFNACPVRLIHLIPLVDKLFREFAHGRHNSPAASPWIPEVSIRMAWIVTYTSGKRLQYKEFAA